MALLLTGGALELLATELFVVVALLVAVGIDPAALLWLGLVSPPVQATSANAPSVTIRVLCMVISFLWPLFFIILEFAAFVDAMVLKLWAPKNCNRLH